MIKVWILTGIIIVINAPAVEVHQRMYTWKACLKARDVYKKGMQDRGYATIECIRDGEIEVGE